MMHPIVQKLLIELIKPWELLNEKLSNSLVLNQTINDYIILCTDLSTRIYHFPETQFSRKDLVQYNKSFSIIRDLNNSTKHGILKNPKEQCYVNVVALIEGKKGDEELYRFSRNQIEIIHAEHGRIDFMHTSMEAILFIINYFNVKTSWKPIVRVANTKFTENIEVFADSTLQVEIANWYMKFIELNNDGSMHILPKPTKFKTTIAHNWVEEPKLGTNFTVKQEEDGTFTVYNEANNSVRIHREINEDQTVNWRSKDNINKKLLERIGKLLDSSNYEKGGIISEFDL